MNEIINGIYVAFLANWDKLRALSPDRSDLFRVTMDGETVGTPYYLDGYALQASCVGEVFQILNMNHPADYRQRSLCVGDVVVDPTGRVWVVQGMGWKELDTQTYPGSDFQTAAKLGGSLQQARANRIESEAA
jgi:hypothetical protein